MASASRKCPQRLRISLFFILCYVSWVVSSVTPKTEVKDSRQQFRFRREGCQDGDYTHNGGKCCLCAAGQRRVKHCSTNPEDRECELCKAGTYNAVPNSQENCEACTVCSSEANLEEKVACTPYRDRVCQCKQNHYCGTEPCTACTPCTECGGEGIKVACNATTNTVCNDKNEGGINLAAVLIPIFIAIALIVLFYICWKKKCFVKIAQLLNCATPEVTGTEAEERELREGVDLSPHLTEIAEVLGWKVMRAVARKSKMSDTVIENQTRNHPADAEEQTIQLLKAWVEKEGRNASATLIQRLRQTNNNAKADRVKAIIYSDIQIEPA
ncbi:tumor necrosis factor receptor superfamily member 6 [Centroberyx affinis]|uniref:tumor necrosis factor receptor superfamily member 6 n=1 Tax=Centroberyx affinis TaxID=166261 RepID=UPI003A5C42F7